MPDVAARVLSVEDYPLPYYRITVAVPEEFGSVQPGQFVMVLLADRVDPYLRRAYSVHDVRGTEAGHELDILAKVIGVGTEGLSQARPGDEIRVLGPQGRGFSIPSPATQGIAGGGRVAVVAGGIGSAALLLLSRELLSRRRSFDWFYGGRSAPDLCRDGLFAELAAASGGAMVRTTEDGSAGETGLVTSPLADALEQGRYDFIYSCGPMPMLRSLAALSRQQGVPGEAALETPMGCGYGACLGCAVPHVDGHFALCCRDGPVFRFDEVVW